MLTEYTIITIIQISVLVVLAIRYQSLFTSYTEKALLWLFAFSLFVRQLLEIIFRKFFSVGNAKTQLIIETLSVGVPLLAIFCIAVIGLILQSKRFVSTIYRYEAVIILFGLYNLVTFMIGIAMGNDISHLLSDTYKLIVFPLGYLAVLTIVNQDQIFEWFRAVYILMTVSLVAVFAKQATSLLSGSFIEFSAILGVFYLVPLFLMTLSTPEARNPLPISRTVQFGLFTLSFGSILLSLSRSDWIVTACVVGTFLLISNRKRTLFQPLKSIAGVVLASSLGVVLLAKGKLLLAQIKNKIAGVQHDIAMLEKLFAYERRARGSLAQKIAEGLDVLKHMAEHGSLLHYLFGFGNGAQYETIISKVSSSSTIIYGGLNHQIHNFLFAQLFRRGIIGVILGSWMFFSAILVYFRAWKRTDSTSRTLYGAAFLTLVALFIKIMSTAAAFYNVRFIIFLGLAGVLLRTAQWAPNEEKERGTPNP